MAKFCGKCGARLVETAKFCGKCGNPSVDTSTTISGKRVEGQEKQGNMKMVAKCIVGTLAIIYVLNLIWNYTGYNGLLKKVMVAYNRSDIHTLASLSSYMYHDEEDVEEYYRYYFENMYGRGAIQETYEVNAIYAMSEREVSEFLGEINYASTVLETSIVDKIVVADLTVTAKFTSKTMRKHMKIIMSKEGGDWRLLNIE